VSKLLLEEGADLNIFDPKVESEQIMLELSNSQSSLSYDVIKKRVKLYSKNILDACHQSHALVVCTEWDMFKVTGWRLALDLEILYILSKISLIWTLFYSSLFQKDFDYEEIYKVMQKPAFIFDGRLILDHEKLISIGFHVEAIGKRLKNFKLN
jgi:UDPglucose 6-dehydrogenase